MQHPRCPVSVPLALSAMDRGKFLRDIGVISHPGQTKERDAKMKLPATPSDGLAVLQNSDAEFTARIPPERVRREDTSE